MLFGAFPSRSPADHVGAEHGPMAVSDQGDETAVEQRDT